MQRLALLLLLAGCAKAPVVPAAEPTVEPTPEPTPDRSAACCEQCLDAASKDPQARDLSLVPCGDYAGRVVNGVQVVSDSCGAWFKDHARFVQDCR